ncbi:MAG: S8 family serine peptidase [Clostridia bacterium]|nr:S8 family serine peptidase [Clostridia bacterium]
MKKARTILAIMLALVMVLSVLPASFADAAKKVDKLEKREASTSDQRIQSKTGRTFKTLDERLSAQKSIDPEAIVTAIVVFDDPALSDSFTAEEIRAKKAESAMNRLSGAHDVFFKSLSFEAKRMYDYTALINGMSIQTAYKNLAAMEKMDGVKKVYIANEYDAPVVQKPTQANANIITGAYSMQNIGLFGDGMVVAVLDTGLNLTHEAFQDYGLIEDPAFTEEYVSSVPTTVEGKYVSAKIPFSYDYYDMDDDVMDYNGHGSHVSGTISGLTITPDGAITFMGAAPMSQLVFMKIFADQAAGTNSGIYMAALEDCFLLGVDAINMSIGAPGGFVHDWELDEEFGNVYKKLDQAGVIVCISAGNEYSMSHNAGNFAGDGYVLADYADYAEVASPSTYEGNVSVASMENLAYPSLAIVYNGEAFPYVDNCDDGEHGWLDAFGDQTVELVYCGKGSPEEIPDEVEGKVALVVRGDLSFSEKNANVAEKGAVGMILFNNAAGSIGMLIDPYYVPAISIQQEAGQTILAGLEDDNTVSFPTEKLEVENPNAWLMSTFSSWGTTPSLELKPTITAPGGMIYSAVAGASDAYEVYSGTSMASPNACGSFVLLTQYLKETYPSLSKAQRAELAEDIVESTATLPIDGDGYLYSPRKSGAGILNLENAVTSPIYFVEPIVNLFDDPEKTGEFNMRFTAVNLSDEEQVYDLEVIGLYDHVTQGYNTLTSDYLFDGQGMTVEGPTTITVPANGTYEGKIKITLDDAAKEYFDATFANGNFIEGYVYFTNQNPEAASDTPVAAGLLGDANLDDKVTAADAAEILRAVVGLTELDAVAAFFADVNQDGSVTAADASFILRAVVGLETLPTYTPTARIASTDVHFTFNGFYGDWTQGPVLDKVWTNSPDYLMYFAAENVLYPQYAAAGYLPTDLFDPMEVNIKPHMTFGVNAASGSPYTYFATNPAATIIDDEEINALAWEDLFETYDNPLHNAISNENTDGVQYLVDEFYSEPIQLRNARHLIMTVSDAMTGEIYYVDDTEYLGKAYFDNDTATWGPRASFYWDGIVTNEESELYDQYVPNGTICLVTYETMVDYPGAELNTEYQFQLLVDTESPVITNVVTDEEAKTLTVSFADNGSGMCFAEAFYYDSALDGFNLGYGVGTEGTSEMVFDLSEVPEDVSFVELQAIDYATNVQSYVLNLKTGEVLANGYEFGTVEFAVDQILNNKEALGVVTPIQGIITDIYNGFIFVSSIDPIKGQPMGMAINLADKSALEEMHVGDAYVFAGELDNYYGCPRLDNAEATYTLFVNEDYEEDVGDIVWSNVIYPVIYYPRFGLGEEIVFDDIFENPELYVGTIVYFEDLDVLGVTEVGDGTRTISVTNGNNAIDIVGSAVGENASAGDAVYYGWFVPVYDMGTLQLRPLQDGNFEWLVFYSDME